MDIWYFVDMARQRHGPVDATAVAAAFQAGQLNDDSLVWREGLAQWAPLRQFRDELGMGPAMAPAAPVAPAPAAQEKKNNGCLIAAVVLVGGGMALIVVLAILAAIALPAYQDYLVRSKVAQAVAEADIAKWQVEDFLAEEGRCPTAGDEIGLAPASAEALAGLELVSLGEGRCVIELTLAALPQARDLDDARIYLTRDAGGEWTCSSDLASAKRLPERCQ